MIKYSTIGKYRTELLGFAMLNVFALHFLVWTRMVEPQWLVTSLNFFGKLVFTEGFVLLSGYGLYHSMYYNNDVKLFYKKRFKRLIVPYWLIATPFFIVWFVSERFDIVKLILRLSTLEFWINGNFDGMWYISTMVVFYMLFPLIYIIIKRQWGGVFLLLTSLAFLSLVFFYSPKYFKMTELGIIRLPIFIVGAWMGKQALGKKKLQWWLFAVLTIVLMALRIKPLFVWMNIYPSILCIISSVILCLAFIQLDLCNFTMPLKLLRWIGGFTLELYIIHLLLFSALGGTINNVYIASAISIIGALLICKPVHQGCEFVLDTFFNNK